MKKLLGLFAIGGVGYALRKLTANKANPANVNMDQPQKTTEKVEAAVGQPVRP